jgi:hypothetical protein
MDPRTTGYLLGGSDDSGGMWGRQDGRGMSMQTAMREADASDYPKMAMTTWFTTKAALQARTSM